MILCDFFKLVFVFLFVSGVENNANSTGGWMEVDTQDLPLGHASACGHKQIRLRHLKATFLLILNQQIAHWSSAGVQVSEMCVLD